MNNIEIVGLLIIERNKIQNAIDALTGKDFRIVKQTPEGAESMDRSLALTLLKPSGRRVYTPAQKAEVAARMRKFWAAKRKQSAPVKAKRKAA